MHQFETRHLYMPSVNLQTVTGADKLMPLTEPLDLLYYLLMATPDKWDDSH